MAEAKPMSQRVNRSRQKIGQRTEAEKAEIRRERDRHYHRQTGEEPGPDVEVASDAMTREDMVAELRAAGRFVPPKSKDETLRRKIEELRAGDA